jgi:arabinose-5-phosphate isomerase
MHSHKPILPATDDRRLTQAARIMQQEAAAIFEIAARLDHSFLQAADLIYSLTGCLHVVGVGKAGLIGQKLAATFCSTGTRSQFLHPTEALHGDLGRVHATDGILILSYSGETEEILRLLPSLAESRLPIIAITAHKTNSLAQYATVTMELGALSEAGDLQLAPSTTTTAMLALGDALALTLSNMHAFTPHDFVKFHPGGTLGRKLTRVEQVMRPLHECRVASAEKTVREVFVGLSRPGRRSGAIMLVDSAGKLAGIFTDSDLARLLESNREQAIHAAMSEVMTRHPQTVNEAAALSVAWEILSHRKISELPVLNEAGCPVGMIDITDVLSLAHPQESWKKKRHAVATAAGEPQVFPFPKLANPTENDA